MPTHYRSSKNQLANLKPRPPKPASERGVHVGRISQAHRDAVLAWQVASGAPNFRAALEDMINFAVRAAALLERQK